MACQSAKDSSGMSGTHKGTHKLRVLGAEFLICLPWLIVPAYCTGTLCVYVHTGMQSEINLVMWFVGEGKEVDVHTLKW